jgi:hypothetical protein
LRIDPLELPVEEVLGLARNVAAAPEQHQQDRRGERNAGDPAVPEGGEPALTLFPRAHIFGRKDEQAEHAPAEDVAEPHRDAHRHEDPGAEPVFLVPRQPQPESEGIERQRHRQHEIDEAPLERETIGERQREGSGGGDAAMRLMRDREQPRDRERRDR